MPSMVKKFVGGVALTVSLLGAAQAVPLSDLLAGGSITVGDKRFDEWSAAYSSTDPARQFDPANIDVAALSDGGVFGLKFSVVSQELSVDGDGLYAFVDLLLGFRASVLPGSSMGINGVTLTNMIASYSFPAGAAPTDVGNYIQESVGTTAGTADLGDGSIEFSYLEGDGQTDRRTAEMSFAPQGSVYVTKNILVWATELTEGADLFGFEQRFSQTPIPEPASLALAGLALAGLIGMRRRAAR